jgi:hypothetical protein
MIRIFSLHVPATMIVTPRVLPDFTRRARVLLIDPPFPQSTIGEFEDGLPF